MAGAVVIAVSVAFVQGLSYPTLPKLKKTSKTVKKWIEQFFLVFFVFKSLLREAANLSMLTN